MTKGAASRTMSPASPAVVHQETGAQIAAAHSTQKATNISHCGIRVRIAGASWRGPQSTECDRAESRAGPRSPTMMAALMRPFRSPEPRAMVCGIGR